MTVDHPVKRRKKLIEVAIPLEAINAASAQEKSIRGGHPSTLHLWWARRPLAAARGVIFSQLVDDPSAVPEEFPDSFSQDKERDRLFSLIAELVKWENSTNHRVLGEAQVEIRKSWGRCCADNKDHPLASSLFIPEKLPAFHDPFAGGGSIPVEAQRLGLECYATDLNPVPVLLNKALVEIPSRYSGCPPLFTENSIDRLDYSGDWPLSGFKQDIAYYAQWMHGEARLRLSKLYPKVKVEGCESRPDLERYANKELVVISWIWARTVKSPSPPFSHVDVPLMSTFMLFNKSGQEAYLQPNVKGDTYSFDVRRGKPENPEFFLKGTKNARGANFTCILSGAPIDSDYIKSEGRAGRIGSKLVAIVAEGQRERVYLAASPQHVQIANQASPSWKPETPLGKDLRALWTPAYGLTHYGDLFTNRQLVALTTLADLVQEARAKVITDLEERAGGPCEKFLSKNCITRDDYAISISLYLSFIVSKLSDLNNNLVTWKLDRGCPVHLFARQAIPMSWDFPEANLLSDSSGSIGSCIRNLLNSIAEPCMPGSAKGQSFQRDAQTQDISKGKIVSTDPPYYDNIGYSDLSDFFYVWLRRSMRPAYPDLFATLATPKAEELVAIPYRHKSKKDAERFFLEGMSKAMSSIARNSNKAFPVTIYYAFKQSESRSGAGAVSTGWETFLQAMLDSGFQITGTWPVRTEMRARQVAMNTNALASSVVLVCRERPHQASSISRNDFRRQLRKDLPSALRELERANIAPVDVAQAAIGPGMAIFSSVRAVLNPDDSSMSVREALIEINATLDEYLSQEEGDLDAESRFALTFFETFGYAERDFGDAEGLAMARNLSVDGIARAGIICSVAGKVKLLQRSEIEEDWDPARDRRLCVWEATQQLIKRLETGEQAAAALLAQLKDIPGHGDLPANCRALSYRLYNHCEKTKQAEEARAYNGLVIAWPELEKLSALAASPVQPSLL